jgi:hypothetical protein
MGHDLVRYSNVMASIVAAVIKDGQEARLDDSKSSYHKTIQNVKKNRKKRGLGMKSHAQILSNPILRNH